MFDDFVRTAFAACSTKGTTRYSTKGLAVDAFNAALQPFGFCLEPEHSMFRCPGGNGRAFLPVWGKGAVCAGYAVFNWRRIDGGKYEFTGRLLNMKTDPRIARAALRIAEGTV